MQDVPVTIMKQHVRLRYVGDGCAQLVEPPLADQLHVELSRQGGKLGEQDGQAGDVYLCVDRCDLVDDLVLA